MPKLFSTITLVHENTRTIGIPGFHSFVTSQKAYCRSLRHKRRTVDQYWYGSLGLQVPVAVAKFLDLVRLPTATPVGKLWVLDKAYRTVL